ncbi:hypothetical protein POTOM_019615 [Populus tomentosa]|uniref:Uncharacterized protein n=1 Tax=Populus tomentosa TaxID=118781 RepID=A0A8X7ZVX7_POPTO|nr:hypothetical protein POTOM_019615 [Populus tomentosa]
MGRWFNWWDVMIRVSAIDLSRLLQPLLTVVDSSAGEVKERQLRLFEDLSFAMQIAIEAAPLLKKRPKCPLDLLQLRGGEHCLLCCREAQGGEWFGGQDRQSKGFLASSAEASKCLEAKDGGRMNLRKLVKVVLGEEKDVSRA